MSTVLFVEDDPNLVQGLAFALRANDHTVHTASSLCEAKEKWQMGSFDLVILDIDLPDGSGYDFCRFIRQATNVPILFLSAADQETDIIMGLDLGGDDYITKPFKLAVFLSRVRALLRRSQMLVQDDCLHSHEIMIKLRSCEAFKQGKKLTLTSNEYRLLRLFMEYPNQVLSSDQILSELWDHEDHYFDTNTTSVYIRRLRMKIEDDPSEPQRILTIRGLGYQWKEEDQ